MNITLRQLEVFEAVARHLNYTRAAEELFLTQPAVSMQIKQLEEHLGQALFEQMGKKIYLTEAGREVYRYSHSIGMQLNEMQMVLAEMQGLQHGKLSLTVASTANYFLPTLLGVFSQRHQGVTVDIDVTNRENLLKALAGNTTDFAIMGHPPDGLELVNQLCVCFPLRLGHVTLSRYSASCRGRRWVFPLRPIPADGSSRCASSPTRTAARPVPRPLLLWARH